MNQIFFCCNNPMSFCSCLAAIKWNVNKACHIWSTIFLEQGITTKIFLFNMQEVMSLLLAFAHMLDDKFQPIVWFLYFLCLLEYGSSILPLAIWLLSECFITVNSFVSFFVNRPNLLRINRMQDWMRQSLKGGAYTIINPNAACKDFFPLMYLCCPSVISSAAISIICDAN